MKVIRILALRRLRLQPLRAAVAAITVAAGVSLAVAIVTTTSSLSASVREAGEALAGPTPIRVIGATARGGLAADVITKVEATEGVAAAVPLVQAITVAENASGTEIPVLAFGVDCRVEALVGAFGCDSAALAAFPAGAPPFVAPALAASVGAGGALRTDEGRIALDNAAVVPALDGLNGGHVVAYPMAEAQRLFARPNAVDVIYVEPVAGTDVAALKQRLETAVGPWNGVLDATDPPPVVGVFLAAFLPLFSLLGIMVLGVGAILVRNTVTLSLEERRRQLAIVAALGGRARVLVGGTLAEAAALGLVGGLLGAGGGILLAHPITASMSEFTRKTAGIPLAVHVTPFAIVLGGVLGAVVAILAALRPARRVLRADVAAELSNREQRAEAAAAAGPRWIGTLATGAALGLALCWVAQRGGALQPWQAAVAPLAGMLAITAAAMLTSALAPRLVPPLRTLAGNRGAPTRLAFGNLAREPRRTGVMAVAIALAVSTAVTTSATTTAARQIITENITDHLGGVSVSTLDPNNSVNIDARMSPAVVAGLAALPGVATVEREGSVLVGHTATGLIGVNVYTNPWLDGTVLNGTNDRARFDAGEVLIGPALARQTGLRAGDILTLDTPTGRAELPVLGVQQDGDFNGRNVLMSMPLLEELYGPQPPTFVTVTPQPGVTSETLQATIEAAALDPDLVVQTAPELADQIAEAIEEQTASFWALQRGLLAMSFVAVLSTLLLVGVQRQRELGLLAAVGMEPAQLGRMVLAEGAIVAAIGVLLSAALSAFMTFALVLIAPIVIGYKGPFVFEVPALGIYGVVALIVALLAAMWPAWRSARIEVLPALQYE